MTSLLAAPLPPLGSSQTRGPTLVSVTPDDRKKPPAQGRGAARGTTLIDGPLAASLGWSGRDPGRDGRGHPVGAMPAVPRSPRSKKPRPNRDEARLAVPPWLMRSASGGPIHSRRSNARHPVRRYDSSVIQ